MHSRSFPASVKPRHKPGDSDRRGRARTVASSSRPARPSSHSHTGRPGPGACDCERRSPFSTTGVTTHPPTWPPPTEAPRAGRLGPRANPPRRVAALHAAASERPVARSLSPSFPSVPAGPPRRGLTRNLFLPPPAEGKIQSRSLTRGAGFRPCRWGRVGASLLPSGGALFFFFYSQHGEGKDRELARLGRVKKEERLVKPSPSLAETASLCCVLALERLGQWGACVQSRGPLRRQGLGCDC